MGDIFLLRKHAYDDAGNIVRPLLPPDWLAKAPVNPLLRSDGVIDEDLPQINEYFAAHPENVIGDTQVGHGMYEAATLAHCGRRMQRYGNALRSGYPSEWSPDLYL